MMTFAMIAAAWPLVTMRQMGATTFAPSNQNALVGIHVRHPVRPDAVPLRMVFHMD